MNINRCYEILEISSDATYEEAKAAYRLLVQVWHPDKHVHNEKLHAKANSKIKEINSAWCMVEAHFKNLAAREAEAKENGRREREEGERSQQTEQEKQQKDSNNYQYKTQYTQQQKQEQHTSKSTFTDQESKPSNQIFMILIPFIAIIFIVVILNTEDEKISPVPSPVVPNKYSNSETLDKSKYNNSLITNSNFANITFFISNDCPESKAIDIILFKNYAGTVYQSDSSNRKILYGKTNRYDISCSKGEEICYGASAQGYNKKWGSGINRTEVCSDCCIYCGDIVKNFSLTCQEGSKLIKEPPLPPSSPSPPIINVYQNKNDIDSMHEIWKSNLITQLNTKLPNWKNLLNGNSKGFNDCIANNSENDLIKKSINYIIDNNKGIDESIDILISYDSEMIANTISDCSP